jgi:hypothetical protein
MDVKVLDENGESEVSTRVKVQTHITNHGCASRLLYSSTRLKPAIKLPNLDFWWPSTVPPKEFVLRRVLSKVEMTIRELLELAPFLSGLSYSVLRYSGLRFGSYLRLIGLRELDCEGSRGKK